MIQPSDAGFSALFYAHPVPMWVYDLETFRFVAVNAAAVIHYGYAEAEFLAMTLHDIRPPEERGRLDENLRQPSVPSIEKSGIWQHVKKDGTTIDVEITSHPLWFNERACRFVLAHDVTERVAAHDKIMRLSRIYAVSSGINAAITRIHTRDALFDEVCRIAVHDGAFRTAWIGVLEDGVKTGVFRSDVPVTVIYPLLRDGLWLTARWFKPTKTYGYDELAADYLRVFLEGIAH